MIDITKQFEWNNPKSMKKERLYTEYMKLTDDDKLKVDKYLTPARKALLDKEREKNKQRESNLKEQAEKILLLAPLNGYLDETDFKSFNEILLTSAIILRSSEFGHSIRKYSNFSRDDKKDFNEIKKKMLAWILQIDNRLNDPTEHETLYYLLDELEYVSVNSLDQLKKEQKKKFIDIYKSIDVKPIRSEKISTKLVKYISDLASEQHTLEISEWRLSLSKDIITNGRDLLNVFGDPKDYEISMNDIIEVTQDEYLEQVELLFQENAQAMPEIVIEQIKFAYEVLDANMQIKNI